MKPMNILIVTAMPVDRMLGTLPAQRYNATLKAGHVQVTMLHVKDLIQYQLRGHRYDKIMVPEGLDSQLSPLKDAYEILLGTIEYKKERIEFY